MTVALLHRFLQDAFVALNGLARSLERESERATPSVSPRSGSSAMRLVSAAMRALLAVQQEGRHAAA